MVIKTCRHKKKDIEIEKDESKDSRAYLRIKAKKKGNMVVDKVLWIDDKNEKEKRRHSKITATFKEAPEGDEVLRITLEEKKEEHKTIEIN
jgi:hypothetical protein